MKTLIEAGLEDQIMYGYDGDVAGFQKEKIFKTKRDKIYILRPNAKSPASPKPGTI